eukprot:TRINITY_DN23413_c0_g1_i1.p1 TRINITY_DN23413_c0_g1~~TRINITY_DN23413_c0_g1_i1.p1  ORF type:complete len:162 (+),score=35.41 TRINITY_DN23413_c0_g1_i1:333-818(+)
MALNVCLAAVGAGIGSECLGKVEEVRMASRDDGPQEEPDPDHDTELKPVAPNTPWKSRSFDLETGDISRAIAKYSKSDMDLVASECDKFFETRSIDPQNVTQRNLLRVTSFVAGKVLHSTGCTAIPTQITAEAKQLTAGIDRSTMDDAVLITLSVMDRCRE